MNLRHRAAAYGVLLRRYGQVFKSSWKNRDRLKENLFREDEAEFLPAVLSIQEKPVSPALRLTTKVLVLLVLVILGWSIFGRMDIVVNVVGEVIPHERTKTIASVEISVVRAIHVTEGQVVKKGDLLVELDASTADAERDKALVTESEAALQSCLSRGMIEAIESGRPPQMPASLPGVSAGRLAEARHQLDSQFRDFTTKLQRLEGAITRYAEALPLVAQQARDYKELAENHDVPMHAYLEKEHQRVEVEGQLVDAKNQKEALIAEIRRTAYDHKAEAVKIIGAARQDVRKNEVRSRYLQLTAPVDGTVQQLTLYTVGGVVAPAQPLMKIVPREDNVEVAAMLENKDVGFVVEGQAAAVKIDAFDYTKYGVLPARVAHVSRDAIKDEKRGLLYSVVLALDKTTIRTKDREVPIGPGMSVRADIKTGNRRVFEYFLSPLVQHTRESLNER